MSGYLLYWIPDCDINLLRPVLDLDRAIDLANQGDPAQLANMVRLNWMIHDLKRGPMIKPIFCRDEFDVIVGDTRIMAAQLAGVDRVPVMCYSTYPTGQLCRDRDDLRRCAGFLPSAVISFSPDVDIMTEPPEWIDIGDHRTQHHGHDESRRLTAARPFRGSITREWLLQHHDWGDLFR